MVFYLLLISVVKRKINKDFSRVASSTLKSVESTHILSASNYLYEIFAINIFYYLHFEPYKSRTADAFEASWVKECKKEA